MSTTIDFETWLNFYVDPEEYGQVETLLEAIEGREGDGFWEVATPQDQILIRQGDGDWLRIASEKALDCFFEMLERHIGAEGLGIESWCAMQRAIDNDKS